MVDAMIGQLEGTSDIAQLAGTSPARESTDRGFPMSINDPTLPAWPLRILLACFIFGIIGLFTYVGIITPGMGWFLYFFLIPAAWPWRRIKLRRLVIRHERRRRALGWWWQL